MRIGPQVDDVLSSADAVDIAIASTAVIYTKAFKLTYGEYFALAYIATSSGTVDLTIELEQSFQAPATEGAADDNYVEPEGMANIAAVSDENMHVKAINPVPMPWGRFKITGGASNDASTTIRLRLAKQEEV